MKHKDIVKIFRAGAEYGLVNVLGCLRKPVLGFSIGGPEAAGGSNVYVGWREREHIRAQRPWVQQEIAKKCCLVRWMDDLIHVVDRSLSRAGWGAIRRMQRKDFY